MHIVWNSFVLDSRVALIYLYTGLRESPSRSHFHGSTLYGDHGASGAGSMRCSAALQLRGHPSGTPRRALRARLTARRASKVLNWQGALGLLIRAGCMSFSGMRRGAVSASHDVHPYQVRGLRTLPPCSRLTTLPTSHPPHPDVLAGALTALQLRRNLRPHPSCPFYRPPSFCSRLLTAQMA